MNIKNILVKDNIGKSYKDTYDTIWKVSRLSGFENIGLVNKSCMAIESIYYLDDILNLDFTEITN